MKSSRLVSLLATAALLIPFLAEAAVAPDPTAQAKAALEKACRFYQEAGAFRETWEYVLDMPGGRQETRAQAWGVGEDKSAFLSILSKGEEVIRIAARGNRMVATQFNAEGTYAETSYSGDFGAALRRIGGDQAQTAAPPAVVAALGGDFAAFLDAYRLGILVAPLEIAGFQPAFPGKSELLKVEFRASNGRVTVGIDPATHRPRQLWVALGEGAQQVRASGALVLTEAPGEITWPDLAGRKAVPTLADLRTEDLGVGQPAPKLTLKTLDGKAVTSADFADSVVVLDLWATWCVPCWTALRHTGELASWAEKSGQPVKIFAVNTMEHTDDPAERLRRVNEFLRAKGFDKLPVLLDPDGKILAAFRNPGLPSLLIIDRQGRLAHHHSGVLPEMVKTVRAEVEALLK